MDSYINSSYICTCLTDWDSMQGSALVILTIGIVELVTCHKDGYVTAIYAFLMVHEMVIHVSVEYS